MTWEWSDMLISIQWKMLVQAKWELKLSLEMVVQSDMLIGIYLKMTLQIKLKLSWKHENGQHENAQDCQHFGP